IRWAWDVRDDRLVDRSKGLESASYDVVAQAPEVPERPQPGRPGQLQLMMQSLLQERFGLALHHEQRTLPYLALVVDTGGAKLQVSETEREIGPNPFSMSGQGQLRGTKVTPAMLANVLSNQVGRTVEDATGLRGVFDFTLTWAPESAGPGDSNLPSI